MNALRSLNDKLQSIVPVDKRSKNLAFVLVVIGTSLDNINVSGAVTTSFSVYEKFHASTSTVSWTLSAYSLTLGSFILLAGKISDVIGAHIVFLSALALTSLFVLICAVIEEQIIALIVFRALQGMTASFLIPASFAIAGNYYKSGKPLMFAIIAIMLSISGMVGFGFLIGGVFSVTSIGYKAFYYFTFAIGATVSLGLYFLMVPVERTEGHKALKMRDLDYYGSLGFVGGCLLVIVGFTQSGETWNDPSVYVPLPVGVVIIIVSLWFELGYIENYKAKVDAKYADDKEAAFVAKKEGDDTNEASVSFEKSDWRYRLQLLFPKESFQVPNFLQYLMLTPLIFIAQITLMTTEVQYFLYVVGDSPLIAGLKIFPMAIGIVTGALLNRDDIIYNLGLKWVLIGAQLAQMGFAVWVSRHEYNHAHNYWIFEFVPLYFFGWMWSVYLGVYINGSMKNSPNHLQGVISGLLQTVGQVALSLGNSVNTSILGDLYVATNAEQKASLDKKFDHAFYFLFAVLALATVCMLLVNNLKNVDAAGEEDASAAGAQTASKEAEEGSEGESIGAAVVAA